MALVALVALVVRLTVRMVRWVLLVVHRSSALLRGSKQAAAVVAVLLLPAQQVQEALAVLGSFLAALALAAEVRPTHLLVHQLAVVVAVVFLPQTLLDLVALVVEST